MSDSGNLSTLQTAPPGRLPAMQTSGDSPVPGADVSLVPQLDPRLLEVCHIAPLVLTGLLTCSTSACVPAGDSQQTYCRL